MTLRHDLGAALRVLVASIRACKSPRTTVGLVAMSFFHDRHYHRPKPREGSRDLIGPLVPASALVAIEIELVETGLQVRRSGLSRGSRVQIRDLPEDITNPQGPRFSLSLTVERVGIGGAALRIESGSDQRDVEVVYGEHLDSGLRTPSRYTIALGVTRLA